jgi:hypothetical protein
VPAAAARVILVEVPERIELLPGRRRRRATCRHGSRGSAAPLHLASVEPEAPVEHRWMEIRRWWPAPAGWSAGCCGTSGGCGERSSWDGRRRVRWRGWRRWWPSRPFAPRLRSSLCCDRWRWRGRRCTGWARPPTPSPRRSTCGWDEAACWDGTGLDLTQRQPGPRRSPATRGPRRPPLRRRRVPQPSPRAGSLRSGAGAPEPPEQMAPALCASPLGLEKLGGELVAVLGA